MKYQKQSTRCSAIVTTSVLALFVASHASAQTTAAASGTAASIPANADDGKVSEIVVTAQRRLQNIQDVPISINAFTGQTLENLGITSSVGIQKIAPALTFVATAGEGQKTNIVLRGVGLNTSSEDLEGNVGVYVDNTYLASTSGLTFGLFDIDRVEVLKGPQGTLFGESETGGLIHYITQRPTDQFSAYVNADYGSYNTLKLEGEVGGGIAPGLSVRLSGLYDSDDGYVHNKQGEDKNRTDLHALRFQSLWKPTEKFSALLQVRYAEDKPGIESGFKPEPIYLNPTTGLVQALPPTLNFFKTCAGCDAAGNPTTIANGSIWSINQNTPGYLYTQSLGVDLTLTYDFGFATLTSVTDADHTGKGYGEDSDGGPGSSVTQQTFLHANQFQQEFRLNGQMNHLTWTTGLFYLHRTSDSLFDVNFLVATYPIFPPWISASGDDYKQDNISLYGQLEYEILPTVSVIAGIDYFNNTTSDNVLNQRLFATGAVTTTLSTVGKAESSDPGGKIGLTWKPQAGTLAYATVATGSRPSTYQNQGVIPTGVASTVAPETLTDYEVGIKQSFRNIPLVLDVSGYYYDYRDMQTRAFLGFTSYELNKNAKIYGLDATATYSPTRRLTFTGALSLLHGTVYDVTLPNTVGAPIVENTRDPNAPAFSGNLQARYTQPFADGSDAFILISESYRGSTFGELDNNPAQKVAAYALADLRIGYRFPDHKLEIGVYGNNLFDRQYYNFIGAVTSIGDAQRFPGRPLMAGAYVHYSY